jgi:isoleucyl-tRNA synthetase
MVLLFSPEVFGVEIKGHVERVRELILDEVNVKELRWAERRGDFVRHEVRPNFRVLGKRLGARMKALQAALAAADGDALAEALERDGKVTVEVAGESIELAPNEVEVRLIEKEGMATAGGRELLVVLDTQLTPELVAEGRAREVVNRIQSARKDAGLDYADRIRVRYRAHPELEQVLVAHRAWIAGETLTVAWETAGGDETELAASEVDGYELSFLIARA